jgi:hypothetical protein
MHLKKKLKIDFLNTITIEFLNDVENKNDVEINSFVKQFEKNNNETNRNNV